MTFISPSLIDSLNVVIASTSLPIKEDSVWIERSIASGIIPDAHRGSSLGIDTSGHLHVMFNLHGSNGFTGCYLRSNQPESVTSFSAHSVGGTQSTRVSYPTFYKCGPRFFLLFRDGVSGDGRVWMKEYNHATLAWNDIATPLISGMINGQVCNPYLGCCCIDSSNNLHLIWTCRVGEYNRGVFYAKFNTATNKWYRANGDEYTLPIDSTLADCIPGTMEDETISNTGLAVSTSEGNRVHVCFSSARTGSREAYHARHAGDWIVNQVTNERLSRVRICTPTNALPASPCDLELQGPQMLISGEKVCLLYSTATSHPDTSTAFSRPVSKLFAAVSDRGLPTWKIHKVERDISRLGSEMARSPTGEPYLLFQEGGDCAISLLNLEQFMSIPPAKVVYPIREHRDDLVELASSTSWWYSEAGATLSIWVKPGFAQRPMSLVQKAYAGMCEFRFLLYAMGHQLSGLLDYSPSHCQVALGGSNGAWGTLWYPEVNVEPGVYSHVALVWETGVLNSRSASLYLNGNFVDTCLMSSMPKPGTGRPLIGSIYGYGQYGFEGDMGFDFYNKPLSVEEVKLLCRM